VPLRALPVPAAELRTQFAAAVALTGFEGRLSVAVVTDCAMRALNRDFHACDEPTDVLAFALGGGPGAAAEDAFDAEVVVSLDTARLESAERRVPLASELLLYVVHGVLHLGGEDDHTAPAYRRMHARALSILAALGHSNTIDPPAAKLRPGSGKSRAP
jgi:probable rRNA maturation factor